MIDLHTTLNALCTQKSMQPILSISIISISHPSLFLTLPRFDFPTKITSTPCFTSYEPYLGYFHHHHFLQLYLTRSQLHSFSLHPTFGSLSLSFKENQKHFQAHLYLHQIQAFKEGSSKEKQFQVHLDQLPSHVSVKKNCFHLFLSHFVDRNIPFEGIFS